MQTTFVMIKPDGVQRGLIGNIISRFEKKGLRLVGLRSFTPSEELASKHYEVHKDRPFYPELVKFMTSGPCVPFVIKGENAILKVRELMGATDPSEADAGTIRADFADSIDKNIIHGSDSKESAEREVSFFFD